MTNDPDTAACQTCRQLNDDLASEAIEAAMLHELLTDLVRAVAPHSSLYAPWTAELDAARQFLMISPAETRTAGKAPAESIGPRAFYLERTEDVTGFSGTGRVAWGVEWPDGHATIRWCVPDLPVTETTAEATEHIAQIHGHDGRTRLEWLDGRGPEVTR